jgi:hypothetical protein
MNRIRATKVASVLALSIVAASGCGDPAGTQQGLQPGEYRVTFTIPASMSTPGALIGGHEFVFSVGDADDNQSFGLNSSVRHNTTLGGDPAPPTHDYLDPDPRGVVAYSGQWRVQWYLKTSSSLAVRVTMVDEGGGRWRLPFGCNGVRGEIENFPGISCSVE